MYKWFSFNIFIFLLALWDGVIRNLPYVHLSIILGIMGLIFILLNWNMHGLFLGIRKEPDRKRKIKIAKIARKIMPFHVWFGMAAFFIILLHVVFIFQSYGFRWTSIQILSGMLAFTILLSQVITGWLRKMKATGKRRRAHLRSGYILFFTVLLHILMNSL